MSEHELQVRLPYTAWGDGDEWQTGYDELMSDLDEALEQIGADGDDADHQQDYIIFFAIGSDVDRLVRAVRPVLEAHGLLDLATGFLTDPEADDFEVGTVIRLSS
jgi:hypothetical protein